MKKWITTIILGIVLLGIGGYLLWTMTDFDNTVKNIFTKKPTVETVQEYFPSDEVIEIGKAKTTFAEGTHYMFMISRMGVREILILPRDFNRQDINARTYMLLSSGEFIPEEEVDYKRLAVRDRFYENHDDEARILYKHQLTRYNEGVAEVEIIDFYKLEFYDESEVWFYYDEENYISYKVGRKDYEIFKLLETF